MTTATAMGVSELGRDRGTPPRVAGFPGEGAWVRVRCEDGGTLARGWLSVEPTSAGADGAAVAVVTAGTTPAGDCAIGVWTGRVTADRITPEESGDAPTPMWFAAFVDSVHARTRIDGELETVRQERAQLADSLRDADRRHESRLAELVEDACEFADRHSLCGDFDRFMEERGLPGRSRDHEVEVTVTAHLTVSVSARSQADAEDAVDEDDVRATIRSEGAYLSFDFDVDRSQD